MQVCIKQMLRMRAENPIRMTIQFKYSVFLFYVFHFASASHKLITSSVIPFHTSQFINPSTTAAIIHHLFAVPRQANNSPAPQSFPP